MLDFVDKGFLAHVFWLGTAKELRSAVVTGIMPAKTLGRFPVPPTGLDSGDRRTKRILHVQLPMRALLERYGNL